MSVETMTPASNIQSLRVQAGTLINFQGLNARRISLLIFFIIQVLAITLLQKFAIVIDLSKVGINLTLGSVEIALPIFYLSIIILPFFVGLKLDINRLGLFSLFTASVIISLALQRRSYSLNSVLLVFAVYIPFLFYVEIGESTYRKLVQIFLNVMLLMGMIALIQQVVQIVWSYQVWPNLDHLVGDDFLFHGFNYIQPITSSGRLMKPNAIFFLEVSVLSQWTAVALAIELVFFARIWRMAFYAFVLLACFAGTGLLLLAICAPVLIGRMKPRTMGAIFIVVLIGLTIAVKIHWYEQVSRRFDEYQKSGASANHRFVEPIGVMLDEIQRPGFVFVGEGPGTISKENGNVWWVVAKIAYEYGVFPMLTFAVFLVYVIASGAPSQRMSFVYIMLMNFMGGFIIPIWPILIFILGGFFRFPEGGRRGRSREKLA